MGQYGAVSGFKNIDGSTFYFDKNGYFKTGWLEAKGGTKYFLGSDGVLARDVSLKINGVTYDFDKNGKATERKASVSPGTSSGTSKEKYSEFSSPTLGDKKSTVLKECGVGSSAVKLDDNAYGGKVLFGGVEFTVIMHFNDNDRLCSYLLSVPMSYTVYSTVILPTTKDRLGYDYDDGTFNLYAINFNYLN